MHSVVLIVPAAHLDAANRLAELMGWGMNSYSVPLTSTGGGVTHYGLHTWADDGFLAMLAGAGAGIMPPELEAAGYPALDFAAVMGGLIVSVRDSMEGHFDAVCENQGLAVLVP